MRSARARSSPILLPGRRGGLGLCRSSRRVVEELLHLGADPNLVLDSGVAAVHLAARAGHQRALHCLRVLLRQGADPNAR